MVMVCLQEMGQSVTEVLYCFRRRITTPEQIVERLIRRRCDLKNFNLTSSAICVAQRLLEQYDGTTIEFDYNDMLTRWNEIYSTANERARTR